jgi:hypothetical protein
MATRQELISVVRERYAGATGMERRRILDEFVSVTGYHRKHAIRLLGGTPRARGGGAGEPRRIYREAERSALIMLWEAADRICGKQLKAALPTLVEAMERHNYLCLEPAVRERRLAMSAATMDRLLADVREQAQGRRRRRTAHRPVTSFDSPVILFHHGVFVLAGAMIDVPAEFLGDGLGIVAVVVGGDPLGLDLGERSSPHYARHST